VKKKYYVIILSLFISLFIYLFYRTDRTVVNEIAIRFFSLETYIRLKASIIRLLPLNEIIIYSLPEGLWILCATIMSKPYYIRLGCWQINFVAIPLIYSICLEFLQLYHVTNGRFDFMDIWISVIFWLAGNYAFKEEADQQNILMTLNFKSVACLATYSVVYLSHVFK
jgi:hypothetical protein